MTRRKPPPRDILVRLSENQKRDLSQEPPSEAERKSLGVRASYEGYGKHKRNPHAWKLEPFHGYSPDRTYCEDADFQLKDRNRIGDLLLRGISAGLFGDFMKQREPTMLWTLDDNGWIYELRQTVVGQAIYHGYPLVPSNALGRKVLARFEEWLLSLAPPARDPTLHSALREAQNRYS